MQIDKNTDVSQRVFAVDFETYYDKDYSVDKLGNYHYVHDSRFDAYLVAIVELLADGTQGAHWVGTPQEMPWAEFNGATFVAHNASFDKAVYDRLKETGVIPSTCKVEWVCSADLAAYLGAPRNLKGAAKVLLGVDVDKEVRGEMCGVTWGDAIARGWGERLREYVLRDAEFCGKLWQQCSSEWPEKERLVSAINRKMGEEGIRVDVERLREARMIVGDQIAAALERIPWAAEGAAILSGRAYEDQCTLEGLNVPHSRNKKDPIFQAFVKEHGEEHTWIQAIQDYKSLNALDKKLHTLVNRVRADGMAEANSLLYCGASTGRFSGTGGYNSQNLPKGQMFGVDMRSLFIPREGHVFIISDLSQIEARILLHMVGDTEQIAYIQDGMSIYEAHARKTLGYEGGKLKEVDPKLYALAKARVLSLGYGCGATRFRIQAESDAGLVFTEEEAQRQVEDYRRSNRRVVQLWRDLDLYLHCHAGKDMTLRLPSGRKLHYRGIHLEQGEWAGIVQGRCVKLYGGLLAENMTQATARDVLVEALIKISRLPEAKLRLQVHDEVVVEVPVEKTQEYYDKINAIMSTTPDWLAGCPIASETIIAGHYTK